MELFIIAITIFLFLYLSSGNRIKNYSITPLKSINKVELEKYTDITKLSRKITKGTLSRSNRRTEDSRIIHTIVLLTPNHRKKINIESYEENDIAMERLKILSKELNKKIAKYNPQISEKTRNRRK